MSVFVEPKSSDIGVPPVGFNTILLTNRIGVPVADNEVLPIVAGSRILKIPVVA